MGELHIYQTSDMENYLPKQHYSGSAGQIQAFLDGLEEFLYPEANSEYFNKMWRKNLLQMLNVVRNMSLCNMRKIW